MALVANDLKRVLAYSTVSQLGYMVYAVGSGAIFASQFHLLSHAVFKALLFLGAGAVIHSVGTRDMRQMGGLGKQMPLVRAVFVIGALALAGIPILNGFWSKEMVLEAGLVFGQANGMVWAYGVMVFVAGLTALYTLRCVWMVFYGEPRSHLHGHDAGPAMKVALIPLAIGTLTTWLLAGLLSQLLAGVPAFEKIGIEVQSTWFFLGEVVTAPATLLALAVVALGVAAWYYRFNLKWLTNALRSLAWAAANSFGFEAINRGVVSLTQNGAEELRETQTGLLNWNVFGILAALVIVLGILALGG